MDRVLGNLKRGLLFVISAPAGTGKTTLVEMLTDEFPSVVQSVSFTTRPIRGGEIDGVHYNFVSKEAFEKKITEGDFLEHAVIYGNYYGTSRTWVEKMRDDGKHVVLVIDTQGAQQLMGKTDAAFIFVMPPSLEILSDRLVQRQTDTPEAIEKRLQWAEKEIAAGKRFYEYVIVNTRLEIAYEVLKSIFIAEEHRTEYYNNQGV